jgi:2'-hydroxyisoflavone reductase
MPSRRDFLKTSTGAALVAPLLPLLPERAPAPLRLLIIGGTTFIGPHQVSYALARGHHVTLLNRNRSHPDLFKGKVDQIIGDLNADVSALKGKTFDVVLDNPTTLPYWVRNAAQYLEGNVGHYVFVSTESVYADDSRANMDESDGTTPFPQGADPYSLDPRAASYGAYKTFAEQEVQKHYPGISLIVRPGLIVGPLDPSDRFTYWPVRIDRGGDVLAPGNPTDPMQFIDVRDLAEWMVRMAESRETGVYNADGPAANPLPIAEMLYGIKAVTTSEARFTWVPAAFLREQRVNGWRQMPVWMPPEGRTLGFSQRRHDKAIARGLTFRPLAVTAADTLAWHKKRPASEQEAVLNATRAGVTPARETEVLAAWIASQKTG